MRGEQMAEEEKKQAEKTPDQMTAHEYIDATLQPSEGRDEERAKQYKMIAICASLTSITCAIRLEQNKGDEETLKSPLRDNEIRIMNELAGYFKSFNAQPPYINPDDGRSIKLLLLKMMEVAPFVMDELKQTKEEIPLKGDIDLYAVLSLGFRDEADPVARPFIEAVERARNKKELFIEIPEGGLQLFGGGGEQSKEISYRKAKDLKMVTDKLIHTFFQLGAPLPQEVNGQWKFAPIADEAIPVRYEDRNSKKQITLYYNYRFDMEKLQEYGIKPDFTSYDFFVATVLDNLLLNGNGFVSVTKILSDMGISKGSATKSQKDKLYKSLIKGGSTEIRINDKAIQESWGIKKTYSELECWRVLPVVIKKERMIVDGNITDITVKITDFSVFYYLANSLDRITTWDKKLLQMYTGRRTERYWEVMHYLMREIAWMRYGGRSHKLLFSKIYDYNQDRTKEDKRRTREMVKRLLDEVFVPAGYVKSYELDTGAGAGYVLTLSPQQRAIK